MHVRTGFSVSYTGLLCAALVLCLTVEPCTAASDQLDCVVLHQSQAQLGHITTTLSKESLKIKIDESGAVFLANAPTWRVMFYNPTNNKALDMSADKYLTHEPCWYGFDTGKDSHAYNKANTSPPFEKIGTVDYAGKRCIQYSLIFVDKHGRVDPKSRYWLDIYVLPNIEIPEVELKILRKLFLVPKIDGIPVHIRKTKSFLNAEPQEQNGTFHALVKVLSFSWRFEHVQDHY